MYHASEPRWMMVLFAIFAIGMIVRLVTTRRIGLMVLILFGGALLTYISRRASPPPRTMVATPASRLAQSSGHTVGFREPPSPPEKPVRSKRASKPGSATRAVPATPPRPMDVPNAEAPPERFVADATQPGEAAALEDRPDREPELTLYHGMSISGHAIDSLPAWVEELQNAPPGSSAVSFSSDRFASIEEGEKQLWIRTSGRVANELQTRFTKSTRWRPATDFLNSPGLILERCVERTTLDVGQFVEPMYRVHWKVSLSESVKESLVAAHRPLVQEARLQQTALSFLSATALLAFVNVILRLAPCPNGKQPPSETSVGI